MFTIPMRAQKSNSSWSHQPGTGLGPSLRVLQRTTRGAHRRFIFSVGLFIFTIVGLVAGSVGGVIQTASAVESPWWTRTNPDTSQPKSGQATQPTTTPSSTTTQPSGSTTPEQQQTAPSQPTTTPSSTTSQPTPQPTSSTTAPASTTTPPAPTAAKKTTTQPVYYYSAPITTTTYSDPVAPIVPDTSGDIAAMTTAQANVPTAPVTYTSNRISDQMRNRLLMLAASALASATIIFIMSLFGASGSSPSLIRYNDAVSEAITR